MQIIKLHLYALYSTALLIHSRKVTNETLILHLKKYEKKVKISLSKYT